MNKPIKTALFLSLSLNLLTLSGCSFFTPYKATITQGTVISQEALNTLQPGLTASQVKDILGPPLGQDPFNPYHWEYVFYTTDPDFHPDAVRHLVINFDDEQYLENWKVVPQKITLRN